MATVTTEMQGATALIRYANGPRHYLTAEGAGSLLEAVKAAYADDTVRALILTGTDDVFIRHYDVSEIVGAGEAVAAGAIGPDAFEGGPFVELCTAVSTGPKPVIAAINGTCMGGGFELSLACDLRVIAEEVEQIGLPEIRIDIFPGGGGTQRLPRLIGEASALEFILRGRIVDAGEAKALGLVHVLAADAVEAATELAAELTRRSPEALSAIKALVRGAADRPLAEGLRAEQHAFHDVLKTDAAMSSMRDFLATGEGITR